MDCQYIFKDLNPAMLEQMIRVQIIKNVLSFFYQVEKSPKLSVNMVGDQNNFKSLTRKFFSTILNAKAQFTSNKETLSKLIIEMEDV